MCRAADDVTKICRPAASHFQQCSGGRLLTPVVLPIEQPLASCDKAQQGALQHAPAWRDNIVTSDGCAAARPPFF